MPERCDRARQWASLELDGELSELERSLLGAHLDRCPECARVVSEVQAVARTMREAPAETPMLPIALPRRRARVRAFQVAVAAATVAIGISLGTVAGSLSGHSTGPTSASGEPPHFSQALIAMLRSNAPRDNRGDMIAL
jgi:predicted anti-sigma-YlaC factor YlaD